jgi:hypothetical protein
MFAPESSTNPVLPSSNFQLEADELFIAKPTGYLKGAIFAET